jgi:pimeloyl-ACP methyl ester carboxylesterase
MHYGGAPVSPAAPRHRIIGDVARCRVGIIAIVLAVTYGFAPSVASAKSAAPGHYAHVGGYGMYYEEYGRGRPLVLLHGGLNTIAGSFAQQIPVFARTHRVIAIEQVGHGHTPDARPAFAYPQMADDTVELLRDLHIGRADLVGWSDGGIIALLIARQHPELVRRLVVSGVNVNVEGERAEDVEALRALDEEVAKDGSDGEPAPSVEAKVRQLWLTPVVLDKDDLAHIAAPVLVVAGDRDVIRLAHTLEIYESLPNAELCILPGTGHDTFQSAADALNPLILRFLDGA